MSNAVAEIWVTFPAAEPPPFHIFFVRHASYFLLLLSLCTGSNGTEHNRQFVVTLTDGATTELRHFSMVSLPLSHE